MTGWNCFRCGHEVIWQNDYMKSEVGLCEEDDEFNDGLVSIYVCPHCGSIYEVSDPDGEEKENYPYYQDLNKE